MPPIFLLQKRHSTSEVTDDILVGACCNIFLFLGVLQFWVHQTLWFWNVQTRFEWWKSTTQRKRLSSRLFWTVHASLDRSSFRRVPRQLRLLQTGTSLSLFCTRSFLPAFSKNGVTLEERWSQQDWAVPHTSIVVLDFLRATFGSHLISLKTATFTRFKSAGLLSLGTP